MRLNTLQPKKGSRFTKRRKGKGHAAGLGKTSGRDTKDRNQDLEDFIKLGLKVVKCPYKEDYPKEDLLLGNSKILSKFALVICPR